MQEYIPRERAEDWFVHLYCDDSSNCLLTFTGVKVRSWPPHTGATASAYAVPNDALVNLAERLCKEIGFQGIADLDWRLDKRDGQYKLVDFNPRVGNQFRLFETAEGVDVVRALHLDLTGRPVPRSLSSAAGGLLWSTSTCLPGFPTEAIAAIPQRRPCRAIRRPNWRGWRRTIRSHLLLCGHVLASRWRRHSLSSPGPFPAGTVSFDGEGRSPTARDLPSRLLSSELGRTGCRSRRTCEAAVYLFVSSAM